MTLSMTPFLILSFTLYHQAYLHDEQGFNKRSEDWYRNPTHCTARISGLEFRDGEWRLG